MADEGDPKTRSADAEALLAELRLSEARLRGVLNSISDGFYAIDREWKLSEFNAAAERYFGLTREQILGRDFWAVAGAVSEEFKTLLRAAMDGAPMAILETRSLFRPDRYVELRIAPTLEGVCVALTDVTDRWLTRQKLEEMVAQRTAALHESERQLRQAQKLEAMGQLTGGVAHDFNNLLMVVSGGLNLLERSDAPERRDMLMVRMREAVERGARLTKQLLAFSRRHELNPKPIVLADYFADLDDLMDRSLGANVRVVIDIAEGVAPALADPNALQLAILNLAVNARDAMADGGTVTITVRDGEEGFVHIAVADTGVGMTSDIIEHMFEPFFTTKDIGKGSGLGLAQVHGFAEQSGGRVDVASAPGAGTIMTLVLPRADGAGVAAERGQAASDKSPSPSRGAALLVEDDEHVAALTGEMLQHLGWRVTRVASAEAALEIVASAPFGLVFSDVMMPGGRNGIELARAVRAQRADLPIVLASGYADSVRREAEREGFALLSKPYDIETLAAAVEAAVRPD